MFYLGQFIRKRYSSFLTDDTSEVKARSIALNRCIESMQVVLAGLYPPRHQTKIVPGLEWQPIPIVTKPLREDSVLFTESWCPKADSIFPEMISSPVIRQINEENKEFFQFLSESTGRDIRNTFSAMHLQDDLVVYRAENLTIPGGDWLTEDIYDKLVNFTDINFTFRSSNVVQQRLRGGPFIQEIINVLPRNESQVIYTGAQDDEDQSAHKLYIYAAKRYTLSLVLSALGVFNNKSSLSGASLFFEFHEWNDNQYIRLYHLVESHTEQVIPLTIRGCPSVNCPWDTFLSSVEPFIPKDLQAECSISSSKVVLPQRLVTFFGILVIVVLKVIKCVG